MSKYKVGDKFVVEVDKVLSDADSPFIEGELYRIKGFKSLVFDEFGLDKLRKINSDYIDDNSEQAQNEAYDSGYTDGMDEAWEMAKKIILSEDNEEHYSYEELEDIFGDVQRYGVPGYEVFKTLAPQQAKAKIEEWEKSKEEIKVGDEVFHGINGNEMFLVIADDNEFVWVYSRQSSVQNIRKDELTNTGRHIDIQSVLEQIGGKE